MKYNRKRDYLRKEKPTFSFTQLVYTLLFLLSSLWCAWLILAQTNFLYDLNYEFLEVNSHIQQYAPQNRYRKHFEHTSPEQHSQLFAEISHAIRHDAEQLSEIEYTVTHLETSQPFTTTLLHKDEVTHLTDVYKLVNSGERLGFFVFIICFVLTIILGFSKFQFFNKQSIISLLLFITTVCISVVIIGPTKVFYWLHKAIFPPENPWFFYYQDSLMTTFMKAPDLFIAIAIEWLLVSVIIMCAGIWLLKHLVRKRSRFY